MPVATACEFSELSSRVSRVGPLRVVTPPGRPPVQQRALETDVLVSGAGISGLTAALLLARAGKKVIVLPSPVDGLGPSTAVGLLTQRLGLGYASVIGQQGLEAARTLASSTRVVIDTVRELGRAMGGCGYQRIPGYLFSEREEGLRALRDECDAARAAGIKTEVSRTIPMAFGIAGAVRFPGQAQFAPTFFLSGLRRLARAAGVLILPKDRVESLIEGEPCVVRTRSDSELRARNVFLAAQQPFLKFPFLGGLAEHPRHYLEILRDDKFPPAVFWDSALPAHQMRPATHGGIKTLVFASDADGDGAVPLLEYALSRMGRTELDVVDSGSTMVMRSPDGLPIIGRRRRQSPVLVAAGFGDNLFTLGLVAALAVADLVLGRSTALAELVASAISMKRGAAPLLNRSA